MKDAMNPPATRLPATGIGALLLLILLVLTGCALPGKTARPVLYDFGPGPLTSPPVSASIAPDALAMAEIEASPALDSTAVLYRLAYADDQQLKAYTRARWSMPPAQLLRQRLREQLGWRHALLQPGQNGVPGSARPLTLRIELEEFSQLFATPEHSTGLLRLRATLFQPGPGGEKLVAQRSVIVQRPAPSADAAGGVRALTAAADAAVQEIEQWLSSRQSP